MALNSSLSQTGMFNNLSSERVREVREQPKRSNEVKVEKKEPKTTKKVEKEKTTNKLKEESTDIPISSKLDKMKITSNKKSVRKSFMITEKASRNLHLFAESTGRTDNDFLNELLTNLDQYLD